MKYQLEKNELKNYLCLYRLWYLNDLFGIKLIFLPIKSNIAIFLICLDATFFDMSRFLQFSHYKRNR